MIAVVSVLEPLPAIPIFPQACFPSGSPVFCEDKTFLS